MPFSTTWENDILDVFTGIDASLSEPTAFYVGLSSSTPQKNGTNVTEHSIGSDNYQRVAISSSEFNAAASGATTTNTDKSFNTATGDWLSGAPASHFVFYDASSAGNFLGFCAITTPKSVLNGDTPKILAGELDLAFS